MLLMAAGIAGEFQRMQVSAISLGSLLGLGYLIVFGSVVAFTQTNVRLIASTNLEVEVAIRQGKLREDLYYRINTIRLNLPPLAERVDLWETEYVHIMDAAGDIVEWYKGTGLRPFLAALKDGDERNRADRRQVRCRADPGDLQQMRRVDGAAANDDLTRRRQLTVGVVLAEADAGATSTAPAASRDNEARMATPFWSTT